MLNFTYNFSQIKLLLHYVLIPFVSPVILLYPRPSLPLQPLLLSWLIKNWVSTAGEREDLYLKYRPPGFRRLSVTWRSDDGLTLWLKWNPFQRSLSTQGMRSRALHPAWTIHLSEKAVSLWLSRTHLHAFTLVSSPSRMPFLFLWAWAWQFLLMLAQFK